MSAADRDLLESVVSPIVTAQGLDLEDVKVAAAGRRRRVQVIVDSDRGVDLDRCADVSRQISRALDDTNLMGEQPYTLEVSSPGVSRPLTQPRHWRRAVGRLTRVTLADGTSLSGRVTAADETGATIDVDSTPRRVEFGDVRKAKVQIEFRSADDGGTAGTNGESG